MILEAGREVNEELCIIDCTTQKTKNNTPYTSAVVTDGNNQCQLRIWDVDVKLETGKVYNVIATVQDYRGNIGLVSNKIPTLALNADITKFIPKYIDRDTFNLYVNLTKGLIDTIINPVIKSIVTQIYTDIGLYSDNPEEMPISNTAACKVHHVGFGGWLAHSYEVACASLKMRDIYFGCNVSSDLCIAGGLLHDIGKLVGYELHEGTYICNDNETMFGHLLNGVRILDRYTTNENKKEIVELQHIIASHHDKKEHGALVEPKTVEAICVAQADMHSFISSSIRDIISKPNTHDDTHTYNCSALRRDIKIRDREEEVLDLTRGDKFGL